MDEVRKGQIALKLLDELFCCNFALDYELLSEKTEIPEYEIREILEPLEKRLRLEIAMEKTQS